MRHLRGSSPFSRASCVGFLALALTGCAHAPRTEVPALAPPQSLDRDPPRFGPFAPVPTADDPMTEIRAAMMDGWRHAPRRIWTVEYRPIASLESQSMWHIRGTPWWARFSPDAYEFDPDVVYTIDAVAVAQNYGVIDFYVYDLRVLEE